MRTLQQDGVAADRAKGMSSEELLAEYAVTRGGKLFEEFHRRHREHVYDYLLGFLGGDRETAEDVVQVVFMQVSQKPHDYLPGHPVVPWLVAIAGHKAIHVRQKDKVQKRSVKGQPTFRISTQPSEKSEKPEPSFWHPEDHRELSPLEGAVRNETGSHLRNLVANLPEPERDMVETVHFRGMTQREAAEHLGIPPGTATSRLYRGLKLLKELLLEGEGFRNLASA